MKWNLLILLSLCACSARETMNANDSKPRRQLLIDADSNLHVEEWEIAASDVDPRSPHRWRVHKYTLHGGRQEGVDMVLVDNGVLRFTVVPTRGMNLWEARCGELRLGWDSPVTEVVHPHHVNLASRGGLGWLEGFAEWISRCGLESNGLPGEDQVVSNTGEIVPVTLTLHGKINYLPARRLEVTIDPPPARRIRVAGVVDETMMFGPRLRLVTQISTEPGSKSLTISDRVENLGATPQEMQLLYHTNFGPPLLGEGARFLAPLKRATPRDARAAEGGMSGWNHYGPPQRGYVEQVYFLELAGDDEGRTEALLRNSNGELGVSLRFSLGELPCMTLWKNTAAREDGYVTGLEPGTNYPNLRATERQHGRVVVLGGGEAYRATLVVTALTSGEEVKECAGRIALAQESAEPVIDLKPAE
jgi:hypothetical protein